MRKLTEAANIISNKCTNHRKEFSHLACEAARYVLDKARRADRRVNNHLGDDRPLRGRLEDKHSARPRMTPFVYYDA